MKDLNHLEGNLEQATIKPDTVDQKLQQLRQLMQQHHIDYYWVPARDAHNNEYVPQHWQRRSWISHFDGSAGDALIGMDHAYLATDARYFLQAEQQLEAEHYTLIKQQAQSLPLHQWLAKQAPSARCGIDPQLISIHQAQSWQRSLARNGGKLVAIEGNLIDSLWSANRPPLQHSPIQIYSLDYAGCTTTEKLALLRDKMRQQNVSTHIVTTLDAIAWLFNIRGQDIDYNPLIISYAIITLDEATLFVDPQQVPADAARYLSEQSIRTVPYTAFFTALQQLQGEVLLDPNSASWMIEQQLSTTNKVNIVLASSPIEMLKAIKNTTECNNMHEAHRRDAIAVIRFLHWLEENWTHGVDEISAEQKLEQLRREDPHCRDLSFATISGFAENSAIIHYKSTEKTKKIINDSNLYLLDSGGQYFAGTTDITRTIHLGEPTTLQKQHYTWVLQGHLALRHSVFPAGTGGEQLDVLARQFLWQAGLDYGHGTGHGVGCYLCVHEGPQRIATVASKIALQSGMAISNEPGVYFANQYGIRIENVCLVIEYKNTFLTFEDLTKVPYARKLIDTALLSPKEITWINEYHQEIYTLLQNDLPADTRQWLAQATRPL